MSEEQSNIEAFPASGDPAAGLGGARKMPHNLPAEHFYDPLHGRIFATMMRLIDRGQLANPVTLKSFFSSTDDGGDGAMEDYLGELADGVISIAQSPDYAVTIYEAHLRRELIRIGDDVIQDASHPDVDLPATTQIETAEAKRQSNTKR